MERCTRAGKGRLQPGFCQGIEPGDGRRLNKRQQLPFSPAEVTAMEVRVMECFRQLFLRSVEALFFAPTSLSASCDMLG